MLEETAERGREEIEEGRNCRKTHMVEQSGVAHRMKRLMRPLPLNSKPHHHYPRSLILIFEKKDLSQILFTHCIGSDEGVRSHLKHQHEWGKKY